MNICILGWYGTETIGDRAILVGIFSMIEKAIGEFNASLGSLHPFFSERTLQEDSEIYNEILKNELKVGCFDSTNRSVLDKEIKKADLVIMGGGPLMDLEPLYIIQYAFLKAKKLNKKTALLGCGVGPLFQKEFQKCVLNITKASDLVILRDSKSVSNLKVVFQSFNESDCFDKLSCCKSFDPAVECALQYLEFSESPQRDRSLIVVNLREFPSEYSNASVPKEINSALISLIKGVVDQFPNKEIVLLPMHYFFIGGDDRVFLQYIKDEIGNGQVKVQYRPLTLKETMDCFKRANWCIGMRFHSVVLQTILNRRNVVLDYTEPQKGKISGFINDIDPNKHYQTRYINLQVSKPETNLYDDIEKNFEFQTDSLKSQMGIYIEKIAELMS